MVPGQVQVEYFTVAGAFPALRGSAGRSVYFLLAHAVRRGLLVDDQVLGLVAGVVRIVRLAEPRVGFVVLHAVRAVVVLMVVVVVCM